jgi:hypothetical protein
MGRDLKTHGLRESSNAPKFLIPAGIFDVWHRQIIAAHLNDAAISAKHSERLGPRMPHASINRHSAQPGDGNCTSHRWN